jgi:hypothetical protein
MQGICLAILKLRSRLAMRQDVKVIDYADKAVESLQKKYHHMIYRNVNRNIVITAIARELACFIWGIETGHIS